MPSLRDDAPIPRLKKRCDRESNPPAEATTGSAPSHSDYNDSGTPYVSPGGSQRTEHS